MEYKVAISEAWKEIQAVAQDKDYTIRFLTDRYSIDLKHKSVHSLSCNIPAKPYYSILILHYLIRRLKGLPQPRNEWISFRQLSGGAGYYPAFKKRVINVVLRKFSHEAQGLFEAAQRLKAKNAQMADFSFIVEPFSGVPVLINLWRGDEEFAPEANVLFDHSISDIFCTEDIVVMAESLVHSM